MAFTWPGSPKVFGTRVYSILRIFETILPGNKNCIFGIKTTGLLSDIRDVKVLNDFLQVKINDMTLFSLFMSTGSFSRRVDFLPLCIMI